MISPSRISSRVVLLGSLLVMFSGCQSSGDSMDSPPPASAQSEPKGASTTSRSEAKIDACSLLTTAEVEAVLGGTVGTQTPTHGMHGDTGCTYEAASTRIVAPTAVVMVWPSGYTMKELLAGLKENAGVSAFEAVPGIGDEAHWGAETLFVRKGTHVFSVAAGALNQESPNAPLEAAKNLAQKAVQRIPLGARDHSFP